MNSATKGPNPSGNNVTKFVIYRANSEYSESAESGHTITTILDSPSTFAPRRTENKAACIEESSRSKDVFFIFFFVIVLLAFIGVNGYGIYLAAVPMKVAGYSSYGVIETGTITLMSIFTQVLLSVVFSGLLAICSNIVLTVATKMTYQVTLLTSPLMYLALAGIIGFYWKGLAAGFIFLGLGLLKIVYLFMRKKHIRMYRILMVEVVALSGVKERYFISLILWTLALSWTMMAFTGAFGFFKNYLNFYNEPDLKALYAFFFSLVIFGWLWCVNLSRNIYKMMISGLILNDLLRDGALHENRHKLRLKLLRYAMTKFLGQALHSALLVSLAELFVLLVLFMKFEHLSNLISYMFVLIACQHIISITLKQNGLIHNIMFGSSFFDGTFDVYIPFVFYDELCAHVISLLVLIVVGLSCTAVGKMASLYIEGERAQESAILFSLVSGYIALILTDFLFDYLRSSVSTHIVSYGENPLVLSRTSPRFAEAVRVSKITEDPSIIDTN